MAATTDAGRERPAQHAQPHTRKSRRSRGPPSPSLGLGVGADSPSRPPEPSPSPPCADQPSLCEGLWQQTRSSDAPLLSYLDGLRALFPAYPTLLYRLLAAMSSSPASAAAAVAYFARLPGLSTLQALDGDTTPLDTDTEGCVVASRDLRLDAAPSIQVPAVRACVCVEWFLVFGRRRMVGGPGNLILEAWRCGGWRSVMQTTSDFQLVETGSCSTPPRAILSAA